MKNLCVVLSCLIGSIAYAGQPVPDLKNMTDSFEDYTPGMSVPIVYDYFKQGDGTSIITDVTAAHKRQSVAMQIHTTPDVYEMQSVRFCVAEPATRRLRANFAIRFEQFASWTGLGVTGPDYPAIWWWVREDGTIFDEVSTFGSFVPETWTAVDIDIDRDADVATIKFGHQTHSVPISTTWPWYNQDPLKCLFIIVGGYVPNQTVYIDQVGVHAGL